MGTLTTERRKGFQSSRVNLREDDALRRKELLISSPETQSCILSASRTLHSSVQRVKAVGMLDKVPKEMNERDGGFERTQTAALTLFSN